jgi:inosine/xanthosine triphosphate pyrophosphatase family protein
MKDTVDIDIVYEYCCRKIWVDIKTKNRKKVKELQKILDEHGLETWDEKRLDWEGEIEFYTFKNLLKELEKRGYKVKYDIDW